MLDAAVNAVMSTLIRRTIRSAWEASGLAPLLDHPLYTREKADNLRKQAIEMGVFPERKKKIVHLTGVLTDTEAINSIESLVSKTGTVKGKAYRYARTITTPLGAKKTRCTK